MISGPVQNALDRAEVVTAVLKKDDRVLLCHRSAQKQWFPGAWGLPGGEVEPGETATEALVRELREELNISIDEPASAPLAVISTDDFRMQIWLITLWAGTVSNAAPEEHDEVAWTDLARIGELEFVHDDYLPLLTGVLS